MKLKTIIYTLCTASILFSCKNKEENTKNETQNEAPQFKLLDAATTGINFENNLVSTDEFNVYRYRNFYNGGGVSIGDINNDGLQDIYLTSNLNQNKLYLNQAFRILQLKSELLCFPVIIFFQRHALLLFLTQI